MVTGTRITIEMALLDEASELFLEDGDVTDCLDSFLRNQFGNQEFLERMVFLKNSAKERAYERVMSMPVEDPREDLDPCEEGVSA